MLFSLLISDFIVIFHVSIVFGSKRVMDEQSNEAYKQPNNVAKSSPKIVLSLTPLP
jgi:hypothetical protein